MSHKNLAKEIGVDTLDALPRDVSPREYYRGHKDGCDFILMRYPEISDANKQELSEFIRIGQWLSSQGIKTADLYETNLEKCYALFQDLGQESFGERLNNTSDQAQSLYKNATEVLKILGTSDALDKLPNFTDSRIRENRKQFVDYYMTLLLLKSQDDAVTQRFLSVWDKIESSLPPCPQGFVHGDFHLENIMYQDPAGGGNKCALIDFQDALIGPLPYDLLNLLEDARIDVSAEIKTEMQNLYCAEMNAQEKEVFMQWYRVLATQFHCRVIGLFIMLAADQERDSYLIHIPRLQKYILNALNEPVLAPLKQWFEEEGVDFDLVKDLDGNQIRNAFENLWFSNQ